MNTTFKRSVAAFLTAGMLLTGLTACFKSPEEKRGDEITELANQESEIKFDKIIHVNVSGKNSSTKKLFITGYIEQEQLENKTDKFQRLEYKISEEDYDTIFQLQNKHDIYYPFDEDTSDIINDMIKKYDPIKSGTFNKSDFFMKNWIM